MVTFWCGWCGATVERENADRRVGCKRCAQELWSLLRIPMPTDMIPLAPGEEPGLPAAARKQFKFATPDGREVGRTEIDPLGVAGRLSREERGRRRRGA